ncbi:hypothetical protein NONO_c15670 [Nocardia nova SH22a]|uniref:DUF5666 domain-containing protein n=1 Tax=Nocardia nova SH22a TaxID=1415166 RepID=W5TBP8_9NOCA|nr:hypothetical protein [Nocardia nova]AHH16368.1 hypothetical protein NONO_c15670 [Nocardia nova SH22a]
MSEPTSQPPGPQPGEPEHTWGAPQTAPPATWSTKRSLAAAGIAVVIAAAGGGIVYAATHSSGNSGHGPGGGPGMSWGGGHNSAGPGGMNASGQSLHGQFVISDGNGGYTTEITQTGTVTAVSDTSITAKSADDFSQTYTISDSTQRSEVKVGDTVRIQGTEANGTATATAITSGAESGQMADGRGGRMGRPGGMFPGSGPGQDGSAPGQSGTGPGQSGNAAGQNAGPGMAPPMDGAPNQSGS